MIENLAYLAIGFATTFLALEAAWHFTACKIKDKTNKAMFLQANWLIVIEEERSWNNGKY